MPCPLRASPTGEGPPPYPTLPLRPAQPPEPLVRSFFAVSAFFYTLGGVQPARSRHYSHGVSASKLPCPETPPMTRTTCSTLDCVTIGYYEPRFDRYEEVVRQFGEESEAYRDLRFSFVQAGGRKMTYPELMSHAFRLGHGGAGRAEKEDEFKSGDIPNLAAVYLTHYLQSRGLRARYVNLFQYERDKLRTYLAEKPLCVAITT